MRNLPDPAPPIWLSIICALALVAAVIFLIAWSIAAMEAGNIFGAVIIGALLGFSIGAYFVSKISGR